MIIFDCNGVLVDGERISAEVAAEEFTRAGVPMTPEIVARHFFLRAAARMAVDPRDCIVVDDAPVGIAAAVAAGMTPIGFVGGSHADAQLPAELAAAGARVVIADMRALKSTVVALRGW